MACIHLNVVVINFIEQKPVRVSKFDTNKIKKKYVSKSNF